jgi:hypothetical protein
MVKKVKLVADTELQDTATTEPSNSTGPIEPSNPTAAVPKSALDPFDLTNLRLDQSFLETAGVKKLLTTVPVGKPSPQDFVRTHPGQEYRDTFAMIELKEDREFYVLQREIARALPGEFFTATVFTCINRQGVVRLCPVRLPAPDGKANIWHQSLMDGVLHAMHHWTRIKANMALGAYEKFEAAATIPDPVWPEVPFPELLRIGFRDRVVDRIDHPLIKKLRGLS